MGREAHIHNSMKKVSNKWNSTLGHAQLLFFMLVFVCLPHLAFAQEDLTDKIRNFLGSFPSYEPSNYPNTHSQSFFDEEWVSPTWTEIQEDSASEKKLPLNSQEPNPDSLTTGLGYKTTKDVLEKGIAEVVERFPSDLSPFNQYSHSFNGNPPGYPNTDSSESDQQLIDVALSQRTSTPTWSGVASPEDNQRVLKSWGVKEDPSQDPAIDQHSESTPSENVPSSSKSALDNTYVDPTQENSDSSQSRETENEQKFTDLEVPEVQIELAPTLNLTNEWPTPSRTQVDPSKGTLTQSSSGEAFRTRYQALFRPDWGLPSTDSLSPYGEISLILNSEVERNLHYFQTSISERFQVYLDRFEEYKPVVQTIFMEFGLPVELSYLSLVESGFNPKAYSRARAAGPWQFMKATGRQYGLRVNWHIDERRDPVKSTVAAAHHLRDLYDQFGSWPLALAAYNAGAGKVSGAIRKSGTRDYWKIRRSWRYLRRETRDYVPRFIAATMIASNPTEYGFVTTPTDPYAFDEVLIKKRVTLRSISKATGISYRELQRLNPELRRNIVPRQSGGYHLKVPPGTKGLVEKKYDQFNLKDQPLPQHTQWYRVRRGDSLSVVAKRFGMNVRTLKELNNRTSNLIRVGDRLRVRAEDPPMNMNTTWYTVRYGDSLSEIAQQFGMRTSTLRRLNNLKGNLIHVGDRLRVKGTPTSTRETKWYRVRHGDSLWSIAKRFSVSVTDLKILNNLRSSVIRAGRLLLVSQ